MSSPQMATRILKFPVIRLLTAAFLTIAVSACQGQSVSMSQNVQQGEDGVKRQPTAVANLEESIDGIREVVSEFYAESLAASIVPRRPAPEPEPRSPAHYACLRFAHIIADTYDATTDPESDLGTLYKGTNYTKLQVLLFELSQYLDQNDEIAMAATLNRMVSAPSGSFHESQIAGRQMERLCIARGHWYQAHAWADVIVDYICSGFDLRVNARFWPGAGGWGKCD